MAASTALQQIGCRLAAPTTGGGVASLRCRCSYLIRLAMSVLTGVMATDGLRTVKTGLPRISSKAVTQCAAGIVGGGSGSMSRGDILLHVVNHTIYHHGHIADMIYQIPASPPATDLPVFLRDVPLALP